MYHLNLAIYFWMIIEAYAKLCITKRKELFAKIACKYWITIIQNCWCQMRAENNMPIYSLTNSLSIIGLQKHHRELLTLR